MYGMDGGVGYRRTRHETRVRCGQAHRNGRLVARGDILEEDILHTKQCNSVQVRGDEHPAGELVRAYGEDARVGQQPRPVVVVEVQAGAVPTPNKQVVGHVPGRHGTDEVGARTCTFGPRILRTSPRRDKVVRVRNEPVRIEHTPGTNAKRTGVVAEYHHARLVEKDHGDAPGHGKHGLGIHVPACLRNDSTRWGEQPRARETTRAEYPCGDRNVQALGDLEHGYTRYIHARI